MKNDILNMESCVVKTFTDETEITDKNYVQLKIKRKEVEVKKELDRDLLNKWAEEKEADDLRNKLKAQNELEQAQIKKREEQALEILKQKKAEENRIKRIAKLKRRQAESKLLNAEKKQDCLEQKLNTQEYEQRKKKEILITDEIQKSIDDDLLQAMKNITDIRNMNIQQLKDKEREETEEIISKQERQQDQIVQKVMEYERLIDPEQCYAQDLSLGKINRICASFQNPGRPVDIQKLHQCLRPESFCSTCCNYNIGKIHQSEILECTQKCQKIELKEDLNKTQSEDDIYQVKKKQNIKPWGSDIKSDQTVIDIDKNYMKKKSAVQQPNTPIEPTIKPEQKSASNPSINPSVNTDVLTLKNEESQVKRY